MIGRRQAPTTAGSADALRVDCLGEPDRCERTIASLSDEYVQYVKRAHAICDGCTVVRSGVSIVRSMLRWKAIERDGRLGHWTRGDMRDFLLDHFPSRVSADPGLLLDAPTCAKDLVYFMADCNTLTGDRVGVLADTTDEILDGRLRAARAAGYGRPAAPAVSGSTTAGGERATSAGGGAARSNA